MSNRRNFFFKVNGNILALLGFALMSACAPSKNKNPDLLSKTNETKESLTDVVPDSKICHSIEIESRLTSCNLDAKKAGKLKKELVYWPSPSGGWSPELLKSKSILKRHQLSDSDASCLINKFCD